ncbi:homeobox domain protein [Trichuris suis]|nr:homeobox domain protein [Trichuris suis]
MMLPLTKLLIADASGRIKEMVFPKGLDIDRPKRPRTVFSGEQLIKLENVFRKTQYVVGTERHRLSKLLGLTDQQVKVWFQNRRTKLRKGKVGSMSGDVSCEVQGKESIEVNTLKTSEGERTKCTSGGLFPEANFTALSLSVMTSQYTDSIFSLAPKLQY